MSTSPHSQPPRKKRELLIATKYIYHKSKFGHLPGLRLTHRDVKLLREFLTGTHDLVGLIDLDLSDSHEYHEDDTILMIDDKRHPKHLWPTHDNILREIDRLTSDAPEDCHFVFYFSGHGLEEDGDDRASMRATGRDGEIISADGKPILDYILHDHLIKPLQCVKGSKLFALLDCCHSESLLDLQKGSTYSRIWNIGPGQLFIDLATVIVNLFKLKKLCRRGRINVAPPPRRASTKWRSPPTSKTEQVGELSVICLSACRDGQLAHDDCERELTFTKCFLDAMKGKSNITWTELREEVKGLISEIRMRYEETLRGPDSDSDITYEAWTQEPRYSTSSHMDLTRKVSL